MSQGYCGCLGCGASGRQLCVLGAGTADPAAQVTVVAHHAKRTCRRFDDGCTPLAFSIQTSFHLLGLVALDEHNGISFPGGHVEGEVVLLADGSGAPTPLLMVLGFSKEWTA